MTLQSKPLFQERSLQTFSDIQVNDKESGVPHKMRSVKVHSQHAATASANFRVVNFNLDGSLPPPKEYSQNFVKTSKYTILTFLPINLYQQFSRIANLYFLLIAMLQLVPGLSPTSWFTSVAPLMFVLTVNAVKEVIEDYRRHVSDAEMNARKVGLIRNGVESEIAWKDIHVGDIIKVRRDQEVPADMVLLSSGDSDHLCYIETANLDGETNLKIKNCYPGTQESELDFSQCKDLYVKSELPNDALYVFDGSVVKKDQSEDPLDTSKLLLRGCKLRKTPWIVGLVVFAGLDTKIWRNQTKAPRKVTQLERHMNIIVVSILAFMVFVSILCAVGWFVFASDNEEEMFYLQIENRWPDLKPGLVGFLIQILRFIILLNQMIPISLYVTLELVKVFQCYFLHVDREMYHAETDNRFTVRTTTLNEELGQVEYVLSDKTGTLTQNIMGFVWLSVGGQLYGQESIPGKNTNAPINTPHSIAHDTLLLQSINRVISSSTNAGESERLTQTESFLLHLALCNTVVPTEKDIGDLSYEAESPDEEALVQGAAYLGFKLKQRGTDQVVVEYHGKQHNYEVLAVIEFSSDRKRMSILYRTPSGKIRLYSKGADSVIQSLLGSEANYQEITKEHLQTMSEEGYRTLSIAYRDIAEEEYQAWAHKYHAASIALEERAKKIAECASEIERDFMLVGATAVEDKLQDGVPESIEALAMAGINIWVLTGDKIETAISISYTCKLFTHGMHLIQLDANNIHTAHIWDIKKKEAESYNKASPDGVGLVIDGTGLAVALKPENQDSFLSLCKLCQSVVCCRVSPKQKAEVTSLVKNKVQAITLGIGDGANDVGMIKAAHIGVGISGREGRQAVLASDFAMGQFKYLTKLLLVHGRWSFKRNAEVVLYAFYKNFTYVLPNVYYAFFTGFSAQPLYSSALIASYNVFWTSLPTIAFAVLEQDVGKYTSLNNPQLYQETVHQTQRVFFKRLGFWMTQALWHSLVVFFANTWTLYTPQSNGKMGGVTFLGLAVYTSVIVLVNYKVASRSRNFTWINHLVAWLSIGLWFPFMYLIGVIQGIALIEDISGVPDNLFSDARYWLGSVIFAPIAGMLLDFSIMAFLRLVKPKGYQILQELQLTYTGGVPQVIRRDGYPTDDFRGKVE
eukprot:TRINITY_DN5435_c0_g1_i1.p1 TRINITY_DN5435_c0_g1~~TRINITY_DN5435_c0_g1_i1.p1  ORF type:complete len:1141 (+),score=150.88 TRINITY_DN5435_c0_g1_i1:186-3608(+)